MPTEPTTFEERWRLLQESARDARNNMLGGSASAWAETERVDEAYYISPQGKLVTFYGFEPYVHWRFMLDAEFVERDDPDEIPPSMLDNEDRLLVDVVAEGWIRRSTSTFFDDAPVSYTMRGPERRLPDALVRAAGEDMKTHDVRIDFLWLDGDGERQLVSFDLDEALQLRNRR